MVQSLISILHNEVGIHLNKQHCHCEGAEGSQHPKEERVKMETTQIRVRIFQQVNILSMFFKESGKLMQMRCVHVGFASHSLNLKCSLYYA